MKAKDLSRPAFTTAPNFDVSVSPEGKASLLVAGQEVAPEGRVDVTAATLAAVIHEARQHAATKAVEIDVARHVDSAFRAGQATGEILRDTTKTYLTVALAAVVCSDTFDDLVRARAAVKADLPAESVGAILRGVSDGLVAEDPLLFVAPGVKAALSVFASEMEAARAASDPFGVKP